jgi:hypothetical protein
MRGVWSSRDTRRITPMPMKLASMNTKRVDTKSVECGGVGGPEGSLGTSVFSVVCGMVWFRKRARRVLLG